jgi:hypothetical protein
MRHRTLDELSKYLREDLAWRRKENHVLQNLVRNSSASKKQAVLRGAIAALYAHWEGFVKTACRVYLEFVKQRRLPNNELAMPFLGLALRQRLKSLDHEGHVNSHVEFATWILTEWDRRAKLPRTDEVISTSNLNSDVFKSFILGLGLPYIPDYELAEKPVIDALVEMRNHLAHGEWQIVDESAYDEFLLWIDKLMAKVCEQVEDAVALSAYRRAIPQLV